MAKRQIRLPGATLRVAILAVGETPAVRTVEQLKNDFALDFFEVGVGERRDLDVHSDGPTRRSLRRVDASDRPLRDNILYQNCYSDNVFVHFDTVFGWISVV